jgi:predicted AAA+ superfamily ATPase
MVLTIYQLTDKWKGMIATPRYLQNPILNDAFEQKKMAFISGPRQVGKTTLAKAFLSTPKNYFSYDDESFRRAWSRSPSLSVSQRGEGVVILDEIHKDRSWKRKLKGIYDTIEAEKYYQLIITGSAKLDLFRKKSDSLMGRYFPYRLHPFSVAENKHPNSPDTLFEKNPTTHYKVDDLIHVSGFPEPLFSGSSNRAARWSRLRLERLIQEDVRDVLNVSDLRSFQILIELLPERVGAQFSLNALKEDVGKAYATVRSWYQVLESLYFCFSIKPYHKKISRSLRAEPRIFLFDLLRIPENMKAKRLENLTALHLLKACHYWTDTAQGEFELCYVRDKSQREVDFLIVRDKKPWILIECKSGKKELSNHLKYFSNILDPEFTIQLVLDNEFDRVYPEYRSRVMGYEKFFSYLV